jgi:multiple sugar transport system substrate-binding protein
MNRLGALRSGSWRRLWSVATVLTLVGLLAACGGSNSTSGGTAGVKGPKNSLISCPSSTSGSTGAAETGNITLNVSGWSSSPAEDTLVKAGLFAFHQRYPNITANWSPIPDQYQTKMRANVAAGNAADVFYVSPDMAQEYIKAGKLLNLSPYLQRDNVSPSSYYSALQTPFDCADGTVYGIPKDWNSLGLFYNKDMFQAAGLGDPTGWSWSDLQSAAQKLTKKGATPAASVHGIALPADASRFGAFLFANGGQMLSSDGKTAAFNNAAGVAAAEFYTGFETAKTGVMPSDVGAGWDGEAFGKGLVAMTFEGGWMIPYMSSTFPDIKYGIAPLPSAPNGQRSNLVYTNGWGAFASTKHPDAAWKLISFLTGVDYQTQVLHDGFALPTLSSLANDSYFTDNPGVKVLEDGQANAHADFYGAADSKVHSEVADALQSVMLGKATVADALAKAATNVNTFIQQNAAP